MISTTKSFLSAISFPENGPTHYSFLSPNELLTPPSIVNNFPEVASDRLFLLFFETILTTYFLPIFQDAQISSNLFFFFFFFFPFKKVDDTHREPGLAG
jgi:hypothetical protein